MVVTTKPPESAEVRSKRALGELGRHIVDSSRNGKSPAQIIAEAREGLEAISGDVERTERVSLAQLRAKFPKLHPPIVEGLIRQGETANVVSVSKIGKSWLGYGLALSIITGREWLDRFQTVPGRVLLIDNELHQPTIAHRVSVVGDAMGLDFDEYARDLDVISLRGRLRSLQALASEFDTITPGDFQAVLLDAKYRFTTDGASENDNASETALYNLLDRYAEKTGAAFILIHHSSKGDQSGKRVTDVGAGAGAQSRAADAHMILREHEEPGVAVLEAAVRSFPPVDPIAIRFNYPLWIPDGSTDPQRLKGKAPPNEERQHAKDRQGQDAIFKALREAAATARQLRPMTGISKDRLQRLLDGLEFAGHLVVKVTTIRGNKCKEYSLPKEEENDVGA